MKTLDENTHDLDRVFDVHVYDRSYFEGGNEHSSYDDYKNCEGIVRDQFRMVNEVMAPRIENRTHLDVACAYGFGVDELHSAMWIASGMDISEFAIAKARERFTHDFYVADALDKTFWESIAPVGLVTAIEFFEHIPTDQVNELIRIMSTRAEWGVFVINARTYPGEDLHKIETDDGHLNYHSMSWWISQFAEYGELDFEAMFDLSFKFKEYNEDVHWHNRVIVVRFQNAEC